MLKSTENVMADRKFSLLALEEKRWRQKDEGVHCEFILYYIFVFIELDKWQSWRVTNAHPLNPCSK